MVAEVSPKARASNLHGATDHAAFPPWRPECWCAPVSALPAEEHFLGDSSGGRVTFSATHHKLL